ncbi:MAG: hypothetical protein H8E36_04020 [Rhodospirillaceae bacterium]|nr:hypothetical protein [Rhodospirillaceae bacterium]
MAKKSFFSRISKSFKGDVEKTSEELDRELEEAVNSILQEEVEQLSASSVISERRGEFGDTAFIMSLSPLYKAIGGREGRMADNLRESCGRFFSQFVSADHGHGDIEGDNFVMRFSDDNKNALQLAATVVNAIGTYILMDRFKTMDIQSLLIVAEIDDITNDDGTINADRIEAAVKSGGLPVRLEQLDSDAPAWFKSFWKDNAALMATFGESQTRSVGIIDWGTTNEKTDAVIDWGVSHEKKDEDHVWTSLDHHGRDIHEKKERGPDRRHVKKKITPAKERRTSWRPRRLEDSMRW